MAAVCARPAWRGLNALCKGCGVCEQHTPMSTSDARSAQYCGRAKVVGSHCAEPARYFGTFAGPAWRSPGLQGVRTAGAALSQNSKPRHSDFSHKAGKSGVNGGKMEIMHSTMAAAIRIANKQLSFFSHITCIRRNSG